MNPRRSDVGVVLVVAGVVVTAIAWMSVGRGSGAIRGLASTEKPAKAKSQDTIDAPAGQTVASKPLGIPELALKFSPEEFVQAASNKAAALAALFEYTHDPDYLEALKQRVSTDPDAAVLVVILRARQESRKGTLEERLSMLRQAREKFPNDPLIALCLAGAEAEAGNHDVALALTGGVNDTSRLKRAFAEQRKLMREVALLDGVSSSSALRQAVEYEAGNLFTFCGMVVPLALTIDKNSKMPLDMRIEITARIVALSQMLNPDADYFEINGVVALSLETQALRTLPSDLEYGDGGKTVESRLTEIDAAVERGRFLMNNVAPLLEKAEPETVNRYLEMREQQGATAAIEWFEKTMASQR